MILRVQVPLPLSIAWRTILNTQRRVQWNPVPGFSIPLFQRTQFPWLGSSNPSVSLQTGTSVQNWVPYWAKRPWPSPDTSRHKHRCLRILHGCHHSTRHSPLPITGLSLPDVDPWQSFNHWPLGGSLMDLCSWKNQDTHGYKWKIVMSLFRHPQVTKLQLRF